MPSPRVSHARKPIPQGTGTSPPARVHWTPEHLNCLLSIARQAEGQIGDLPAACWWPAFLLTVLDTALGPKALLTVAIGDYRQPYLAVGLIAYELHPHAVAGIENLSHRSRLFPWPWNLATLDSRLTQLAALGGLPSAPKPFLTLRNCARSEPNLLDRLDLSCEVQPVRLTAPLESLDDDEEELAGPNTVLGYAQRYPDLRLELKGTTAYLYVVVARIFERYYGRPVLLQELTTKLVLKWLKDFVAEGKSPATGNSHRCTILTIWTMAHEKGLAPKPPNKYELPKFRVPRKNPTAWQPEQVQRLLELCEEELTGSIKDWPAIPQQDYWFSLILFLYESGARIGAAITVAPADVDLENRTVILRSNTSKTLLEQSIRISATTAQAIGKILDSNRETVWPAERNRKKLYETLKHLLELAGLSTDRKSKFHRMRRTNATQTALHGSLEMAQHQLGHTSVEMTLRSYIDMSILKPIQAVDVLPSVVGKRGVQ